MARGSDVTALSLVAYITKPGFYYSENVYIVVMDEI